MTQPPQNAPMASQRSLPTVLAGLVLAVLLAALDQTIVATALPTIAGELGGLEVLSWVVTAYLLAATASSPIWGKLGDLYGRKPVLLIAMSLFLVGSATCGLAQDIGQMIGFRALQGLGAGGLMALVMATVSEIVPPQERGRYQGYIQSIFVVAGVSGPLLGGLFVDQLSWRWVFYVNVPLGLIALTVVAGSLNLPKVTKAAQVDYLGSALLVGAIVSFMLITLWGGDTYAWTSPVILGLAVAVILLLVLFVLQERRAPEPVVPLRLFSEPVFVVGIGVLLTTTCALFVVTVFVPLREQAAGGSSATGSGLLLIPLMVAAVVMQTVLGRVISRTGRYRWFPPSGLLLMAAALFLLSQVEIATSSWLVAGYLVLFGLGFGMVTQVVVVAIQNAVGYRDLGVATASANFFRSLGGAIGVTIFGSMFTAQVRSSLPTGTGSDALQIGPEQIRALPVEARDSVTGAINEGVQTVFLFGAPVALLGVLIALALKEKPMPSFGKPPGGGAKAPAPGGEQDPQQTRPGTAESAADRPSAADART